MNNQAKNKASQLYQQALLAHHKSPHGFAIEGEFNHQADGENAACGDEITVSININEQAIHSIGFSGDSCAICRASASIMCQQVSVLNVEQSQQLAEKINEHFSQNIPFEDALTPLNAVFSLPIRQQCALLPWNTLLKVLSLDNNRLSLKNNTVNHIEKSLTKSE